MAGSNRSPAQNRGPGHPGWPPSEADQAPRQAVAPQGQPYDDPMLRWAQQRGVPNPPPAPPAPQLPQGHYGHDPYAGYARPDPFTQPGQQTQPPTHPHAHAPRVDHPYDPGLQAPHLGGPYHAQQSGMPQHPAQPPHALDHNAYQHHQHPAQGGGHAGYGREPAPEDTQNWDLSHYSASHGLRNPHAAGAPHDSRAPQVQPGYDAYGQLQGGHGHAHGGAPGYDHAGAARRGQQPVDPYAQDPGNAHYQAQPGYGQDAFQQGGQPLQGQGYDQDPGYEPEPEYEEPERRGPRPMLVVAALVGAIAVGGGLAYGYRMFSGGKPSGKPPIVKADSTPAKAKPAEPGGKEEAHKDKKFVNRLGEQPAQQSAVASGSGAAPQAVASAPADPEAPRKVTTLIVNKDGTITPQAQPLPAAQPPAAPPPAPVAPQPVGSVPGMVVEGFPPRPPVRQAAVEPPVTPVAKAPPVADLPLPKARAATAVSEPKADTPPPAKKKPAQRDDLLASKSAAPAAGAAPVANQGAVIGFVPVLASKKSREEALKSFADLASKYPDVLASKAPDVIEANIPEKGLWYRTVVGPPGSREAAREVCGKLETAGFKGCWVTAYRQ